MRWLVEVTALGKTDKESVYVEAESWQKALQAARSQRGDTAPMSGFSIELLDDGCRAVDPMSRLRYQVRKAPEEATVTKSQPPRPASQPVPAAQAAPVPAAKRPSVPAPAPARTMLMGSAGAAAQPPSASPVQPAAPVIPQPAVVPVTAPAAAPARADVSAAVPSQIIFKREQDATDAMPLTYREYVYLVPPGTTEAAAETLLSTQLELVKTSLERIPPGKLVNLGVFDVAFQGRPPVPPLATLAWKDWRGGPVITFPRRPQPAAVLQVQAPFQPPAAPTQPAPVQPAPVQQAAPVQPAAPTPPPPAVPFVPPPAPVAAAPPPAPAPVAPPPPPAVTPANRPPSENQVKTAPRARLRSEDLIADLFEAMHDLHFVRDALEGGDFCLALAMEKLPSQFGLVHLYDIDKREFLVTSVRGAGTNKLLLRRHPENDPVLLAAMRKRNALVILDAAQSEASTLERYGLLGGARSIIVAPVLQHGRFLGAIEILNPLDGEPYTEPEGNALSYIAEQFAEYISSHGIVTDPERISARQLPDA